MKCTARNAARTESTYFNSYTKIASRETVLIYSMQSDLQLQTKFYESINQLLTHIQVRQQQLMPQVDFMSFFKPSLKYDCIGFFWGKGNMGSSCYHRGVILPI
jgi:hypothetical protein